MLMMIYNKHNRRTTERRTRGVKIRMTKVLKMLTCITDSDEINRPITVH